MSELTCEMKRANTGEPKQEGNEISFHIQHSSLTLPDGLQQPNLNCSGFNDGDIKLNLLVNFGSEENALMVYTALSVDKELQPDKVKRDMVLSGPQLLVNFSAVEVTLIYEPGTWPRKGAFPCVH
ncbi:hypothetical protein SUGI_0002440 [Cryptomeria japonica]|nr:hypothetical protein SUGI_0002440 [Cryptomeria japonica]